MTATNGQPLTRTQLLLAMVDAGWKNRATDKGPYWIQPGEGTTAAIMAEDQAVAVYCAEQKIPVPPVDLQDDSENPRDAVQELRQAAGDLVVQDVVGGAFANSSNADLEFAALRKISDANKLVREKEKVYEAKKDEASKAKKELEASQERLSKIIEDVTTGETMPLFDPPEAAHAACAPVPTSELPEDTDDSWRGIGMEEVLAGIRPASIIQALAEAGITTLGSYADYRAKNKMTDVAGIGESKAAKIEAAEAAFWERWKQAQQPAAQAQVEAPTLTMTEAEAASAIVASEAEKEVSLAAV